LVVSSVPEENPPVDQGLFLLHLNRVRKGVRENRLEEAWENLEQARIMRPRDEDVLNLVSLLEFKRGHYNEAANAARILLSANPSSEVLRANLGLILFKAGFLTEAELELRKALELRPGHLRSHLYLGLLYQMRGKLGLAVEHLRIAGARRRVTEVEEALRRPGRDGAKLNLSDTAPTLRLPQTEASASPAKSPAALASAPAAPEPAEFTPAFPDAPDRTAPIPVAAPEARPLFKIRPEGSLEVACRGTVFVRKGCVAWYSGKMRFAPELAFRGTSLEKILRATGPGTLLVNDPGRRAYRRDLTSQALYVEGTRLLALDHGLTFRLDAIHDFRRNRRVDVLRVQGKGSVVFSVGGPVLAHEVSAEFPLSISSRDLVAWSGDLVASVLDDDFLEEVMQPDVACPPKVRFEGEGTVLTEPPRPRRRAADQDRPVDSRRS
jgi:tetratricopeptide (TPR) repeat protein